MLTSKKNYLLLFTITMILTVLTACGPDPAPPAPTRTPMPTFTPTPEGLIIVEPLTQDNAQGQADALPQPVESQPAESQPVESQPVESQPAESQPVEEQPTETPLPAPAEVVMNAIINVRGGPGTTYNILGGANAGERFPVTGRNDDASWWQIDYNGQAGWVFDQLVTTQNVETVAVAQNIPSPPPPPAPTATPVPPTPAPAPAAPAPAPVQNDNFPFLLIDDFVRCDPNAGNTYFKGYVRNSDNSLKNAVCIHIAFYGPRNTKCSGCDGVGDGNWGFSPFGGPAPSGTPIEIFVVGCPPGGGMPKGGQTEQSGFSDLTPQSPKWTRVIGDSEQCTEITFVQK